MQIVILCVIIFIFTCSQYAYCMQATSFIKPVTPKKLSLKKQKLLKIEPKERRKAPTFRTPVRNQPELFQRPELFKKPELFSKPELFQRPDSLFKKPELFKKPDSLFKAPDLFQRRYGNDNE